MISSKVLSGEENPSYANTIDNLAVLYEDMGQYEKAMPLYIQAKEIREKVLKVQLQRQFQNPAQLKFMTSVVFRIYRSKIIWGKSSRS